MAESKKTSRVVDLLVITYFIGALFTNAYIREYRWDDWSRSNRDASVALFCYCSWNSVFWPVYLGGNGAGWIVRNIPEISVEVKDKQ
jgi:hypothetical protein